MALFSDLDWLIIAAVALFLLFGRQNADTLRTLGRWYGKAVHLKQELLTEFSRAAELPISGGAPAASIRAALLGVASSPPAGSRGIPVAVRTPPSPDPVPWVPAEVPWTGGSPVPYWSTNAGFPIVDTRSGP